MPLGSDYLQVVNYGWTNLYASKLPIFAYMIKRKCRSQRKLGLKSSKGCELLALVSWTQDPLFGPGSDKTVVVVLTLIIWSPLNSSSHIITIHLHKSGHGSNPAKGSGQFKNPFERELLGRATSSCVAQLQYLIKKFPSSPWTEFSLKKILSVSCSLSAYTFGPRLVHHIHCSFCVCKNFCGFWWFVLFSKCLCQPVSSYKYADKLRFCYTPPKFFVVRQLGNLVFTLLITARLWHEMLVVS